MTTTPHFRLPLTLGADGDFLVVEQDSEQEVAQHARAVLATPLGHRELRPDLGLEDTTHTLARSGVSDARIVIDRQLEKHEPRAEYLANAVGASPSEWIDTVNVDIVGVKS